MEYQENALCNAKYCIITRFYSVFSILVFTCCAAKTAETHFAHRQLLNSGNDNSQRENPFWIKVNTLRCAEVRFQSNSLGKRLCNGATHTIKHSKLNLSPSRPSDSWMIDTVCGSECVNMCGWCRCVWWWVSIKSPHYIIKDSGTWEPHWNLSVHIILWNSFIMKR